MSKHLVWDWNGTLLDDLPLVVDATNAAFAAVGGPRITADEHRREFRRPLTDYYTGVLGRPVSRDEFVLLDRVFHQAYRTSLASVSLAAGAVDALTGWPGSQSLLSMWFHDELVPLVTRLDLVGHFQRIDGLRAAVGGGFKAEHLKSHLVEQGLDGADVVLIGDSIDDADAAAAVGAGCVLVTGGFTSPEVLRAYGVPVADTLLEAVDLAARHP